MMIFSLVAMIGLEKGCITSACLQWLCHSGERIVARGPLVSFQTFSTYMDINAIATLCHTCVHVIFTICIMHLYVMGWRG